MTDEDCDTLSKLLVKAADAPYPTWREKREALERGLSASGYNALLEIVSWGWELYI